MRTSQWPLQDAKAQLSQVVDAALNGEPQHITRHGKRAVVVVSETVFESLQKNARAAAPNFIEHLLAIPKLAPPITTKAKKSTDFERRNLKLRDVDL